MGHLFFIIVIIWPISKIEHQQPDRCREWFQFRKLIINFVEQHQQGDKHQLFNIYNYPFSLTEDIDVLINLPEIILLCDHCERKLNTAASIIYITKERKDLCLTCFIKIANQCTHFEYCLRSNMNFYLTQKKWNLMSELLLLNALQKFGYGHWRQIKNYLDSHGHNFAESQIQSHFKKYYMSELLQEKLQQHLKEVNQTNPYIFDEEQMPTSFSSPLNTPTDIKIQAYNQKRQEYLFCYDPEAQKLIADLQFYESDSQEQRLLKIKKLREYEQRRCQRKKRQQFVKQYHMLSEDYYRYRLMNGIEKNKHRNMMNGYLRLMTYPQSQDLISNLTLHSTLKATILQLQKQRRKHPSLQSFEMVYDRIKEKKMIKNNYKQSAGDFKVTYYATLRKKPHELNTKVVSTQTMIRRQLKQRGIINDKSILTFISKLPL